MSNIINVKEERNVLSFEGEVFNLVANSTNFYLKFNLDNEWEQNSVIVAIFNFDGKYEYVELDENRMCQIPPTESSRLWFCITAEPDEVSKLSSTILSLDVEESGNTDLSNVEFYQNTHKNLLGIVQKLLTGDGLVAEYANKAAFSESQVSLTGDEDISGVKNFTGGLLQNSNRVLDSSMIAKTNLIKNSNFAINQRGRSIYTRSETDIYTVDRWCIMNGKGSFKNSTRTLTGLDETTPTIFCQWIENSGVLVYEKVITISVDINGVRRSGSLKIDTIGYEDMIYNVFEADGCQVRIYSKWNPKIIGLQFLVENGTAVVLDNVKLEISEYETAYEEPIREEEFRHCSRYYQEIIPAGVGYGSTDHTIIYYIPLGIPLRANGNIVIKAYPRVCINGELVEITNIIPNKVENNIIVFNIIDFPCVKNAPYIIVNGSFYIDAEIYL